MSWWSRWIKKKAAAPPEMPQESNASPASVAEIDGDHLRCPDGAVIRISSIVDVSAPRVLIRVDPTVDSVRNETGTPVVLIRHGIDPNTNRPRETLVPMRDFDKADSLVHRIKTARRTQRGGAGGDEGGGRTVVGHCESCGHALRVRGGAIRPEMTLTCRCGHVTRVRPFQQP
jgi:hypothetical protein